jgi:hypothetical protein
MHGVKAMCHRIKDRGPRAFELPPEISFRTPLFLRNWSQAQKNSPVCQIRTANDIVNPV